MGKSAMMELSTFMLIHLSALYGGSENTPLQLKLNGLAELFATLGGAAGLLPFAALILRFFVPLGTNDPQRTANRKGIAFAQILSPLSLLLSPSPRICPSRLLWRSLLSPSE